VSRYVTVPRPTEHAALRRCDRRPRRVFTTDELFVALVHAHAVCDRHGAQLFGLQIVRRAGR
jgi:hypothetical protein